MADPGRYRILDFLRGVAILGILPVNIPFMGQPMFADDAGVHGTADAWAVHLTQAFGYMKFISIFSLLFGVGLVLMRRRAEETGRPWKAPILRRLGLLWAFGAAHVLLLWYGDILATYALVGLAWVWAAGWRPRTLAVTGIVLIAVPILVLLAATGLVAALEGNPEFAELFADPEPAPETAELATGDFAGFLEGMADPTAEFETALFQSSLFGRMVLWRAGAWLFFLFAVIIYFGWRVTGLFLIGMALGKAGWLLDPAANPRPFRRLIGWGAAAGIPLTLAARAVDLSGESTTALLAAELLDFTGSLGLCACYVGIGGWLCARFDGAWRTPFEAVGRMALTNYLLQSAIVTTLFYGYGFGAFGALGRAEMLGIVGAVWILELAWSPVWLRYFRYGPVEWLWRSFTYGRRMPMKLTSRA